MKTRDHERQRAPLSLLPLFATLAVSGFAVAQDPQPATPLTPEQLFERVSDSVCTITAVARDGAVVNRGSGFILKDSRLLVTNAHVLAGLDSATVKCNGQYADVLKVTKYDPSVDLALAETGELEVRGLELTTEPRTRPGTQVYVFGSPFGLEGTISPGLASGHREFRGQNYVQISAPVSAGSSGGPVTDAQGAVIGVIAASMDMAQNINFAVPAARIQALPDVDMRLAELGRGQSFEQAPAELPVSPVVPDGVPAAGTAGFRGHSFGAPCGEVAVAEYQRKSPAGDSSGSIRFTKWYAGTLELNTQVYGKPVTLIYNCDERYGMVEGHYEIVNEADTVDRIASTITSRYGPGTANPISEREAAKLGCRFNFSLPGSRHYNPSERRSWYIDDRFRIDMLVCGGKSNSTFVRYSDPLLTAAASGEGEASVAAGF